MNTDHSVRRLFAPRINRLSAGVATAVGSLITLPFAAVAQDDGEIEVTSDFFEEIVVTSTRRESDVQDVPYNIAAFTGDTLQKQRITDLGEFARWVPGLTLTDQGARNSSLLTVRGLNASQLNAPEIFLGNSGGGTVATYIGEVPLYIDLRPYDVDRVEVLIGPQGTLYGAGTLGGAVRYIPNKPDPTAFEIDTHANGYVMSESDDLGYELDGVINVPIIRDKLAFRGLLGYANEPGFIDYNWLVQEPGVSNPEPGLGDEATNLHREKDANSVDIFSARAALLWNITDNIELTGSYYYQKQDADARTITHQSSWTPVQGPIGDYEASHRFVEPLNRENQLYSAVLDWDFGPGEWVTAVGYSMYDQNGQRDQTDLLLNFEYGYETFPSFSAFTSEFGDGTDILTAETRFVSNLDSPVNFIVGAFYEDFDTDNDSSAEYAPGYPEFACDPANDLIINCPAPPATGDLEYLQVDDEEIKEVAVFGEISWQITDRWQATFGARWFDYDYDAKTAAVVPFFDPGLTPGDIADLDAFQSQFGDSGSKSEDDTVFKFNTSVELDGWIPAMDSGTAYFTFSQGYRLGAINFAPPCQVPLPPGQNVCALPNEDDYDHDETDNYELGLKSTWLDNRLTVNTALFYIDWTDTQVETITVNGSLPITANAAETHNYGVELAVRGQITDNLAVFASYAYTKAELSEYSPGVVGTRFGALDAFDGDRLPGTPEHQGGLNVNYTRPFIGDMILDLDYGFTSISDVYTKIGNRGSGEVLGGFTVHNASASVSTDAWTATLYADNLTNKFARTGVRGDTDFVDTVGLFQLRRYYHNVIQPRTIGLDLRYNFDFE
jgi:iron complex outermembrane receptor protein